MRVLRKLLLRHGPSPAPSAGYLTAAQATKLPTQKAVEEMSLAELKGLIDPLPEAATVGFSGAIYRRAMEIAYHSHGTSNEDRTHAAIIAFRTTARHCRLGPGRAG